MKIHKNGPNEHITELVYFISDNKIHKAVIVGVKERSIIERNVNHYSEYKKEDILFDEPSFEVRTLDKNGKPGLPKIIKAEYLYSTKEDIIKNL